MRLLTLHRYAVRTLLSFATLMISLSSGVAVAAPDVTVFDLPSTQNYGSANGIRGYAVGTTSCNVGTTPLNWCNDTGGCGNGTTAKDHPVIGQNMYRLKNGRFDQIGASWLKHGFTSLNQTASGCGNGTCVSPPLGGNQLGVGCVDPYSASLNGTRPLGRKSEVNPTTGDYPYPFGQGGATSAAWNQRMAVAEADMDAAQNPGARYFVEGHYIAPDDAKADAGLNNASYREVTVAAGTFNLNMTGTTVRTKAAIEAWKAIDPSVELFYVDTPATSTRERFHVARKVTEVTPGALWHYEYAVHNLNSNRAADQLTITFTGNTLFSGVGFHDVNAHSNEPYDTTDWVNATSANAIQWTAPAFSPVENTNAIRWSTMYNFWFDADRPPSQITANSLRLFTAGTPSALEFGGDNLFANGYE